jgi:hypothetical protein
MTYWLNASDVGMRKSILFICRNQCANIALRLKITININLGNEARNYERKYYS